MELIKDPFVLAINQTTAKYKMITHGDRVVVGLSGGPDSVALLRGLLVLRDNIGITVLAAHINHNLRGAESEADERFVTALCANWDIPLKIYQANVKKMTASQKLSVEEAARRLRYEYLHMAMAAYSARKIAVAHNMNDNAETVILNLIRGAGLKGLCGIPPIRGAVVRPLIETSRQSIETFLSKHKIPFRIDASNADIVYTRNRIRHTVMPLLASRDTSPAAVIARNAALLADDEAYLTQTAQRALDFCLRGPISSSYPPSALWLDAAAVSAFPAAIKRRVIREGLARLKNGSAADISAVHVEDVLSLLDKGTGRQVALPHGMRGVRVYDRLVLYVAEDVNSTEANPDTQAARAGVSARFCYRLPFEQSVFVPEMGKKITASLSGPREGCTKIFRYDNMDLILRTRRQGDRIFLEGVNGHKKLQDYFTDQKIPRAERDRIPLLANGSDVLWIIDERNRTNSKYKPEPDRRKVWVTVS